VTLQVFTEDRCAIKSAMRRSISSLTRRKSEPLGSGAFGPRGVFEAPVELPDGPRGEGTFLPHFVADQKLGNVEAPGFLARTKALMNLPSTRGAMASASIPSLARNWRASSAL
jgi:hypothetical protein